jgi:hypothetical protein
MESYTLIDADTEVRSESLSSQDTLGFGARKLFVQERRD